MSTEIFMVKNVKCGGCSSTIEAAIGEIADVNSVSVDIESGKVTVDGDSLDRAGLSTQLAELGYPEA